MRITANQMELTPPALPPKHRLSTTRIKCGTSCGTFPVESSDKFSNAVQQSGAYDEIEKSTFGSLPSSTCDLVRDDLSNLDEALDDLQHDISNFSLISNEDLEDTRPLLRRAAVLEKHISDSAILAPMTSQEMERWKKRVASEQKNAARKLNRESMNSSEAANITFISEFVDDALQPETFTAKLTSSIRMSDWSEETQAAYKLLVQCGHSLKDAANLATSERNASTSLTSVDDDTMQDTDQQRKIEYINSKLIGFNDGFTHKVSRNSDMRRGRIPPIVPPKPNTSVCSHQVQ